MSETTTKFIRDISFNDVEKGILVSNLASIEEVNEALNKCVTNESLSNTLAEYRKVDDLTVVSQSLSIRSINSLTGSSMINLVNKISWNMCISR